MGFRIVLALVTLMALGSPGRADPVRIVEGGPQAKKQRNHVQRSLAAAARSLEVCWRGKRPDAVTVDLVVDSRGRVTSARQVTRGAVAQCAAGVLAVQSLRATGSGYRLRAAFATRAQAGQAIESALAPHRARLDQCQRQARNPRARGQVVLGFMIHPDGRITRAAIKASELGDAAMERCLTRTIEDVKLGPGVTAKSVSYALTLRFSGAAKGRGTARSGSTPAAGGRQPRKEGPLSGQAISRVMNKRKPAFSACFSAQARNNRALAGAVVLRFTIRDDGTVRNVKIRETTLNNAKVERCMVKQGTKLRFPDERGRAPTKVWYPFEFSAR